MDKLISSQSNANDHLVYKIEPIEFCNTRRYWRTNEALKTNDDGNMGYDEECETSGATSGEEIWGTPTSGGELDDPLTFPNSDGGNLSVS